MPKRSTPFQAIVHLVRQHYAQPGVTVTESKMLRDAHGGQFEVDVVIEGEFDGEPIVVSVEVAETGRPKDRRWVHEMLRKHRDLPTNRLLLVSKAGFSRNALAVVEREGGSVQALTPELIMVDGLPVIKCFYINRIDYTPTGCAVHVRFADAASVQVPGTPNINVYSADGDRLGPLAVLVNEAVGLDHIGRLLAAEAHDHPERANVTSFSIGVPIPQLEYHLQNVDSGQRHLIEVLEIWGRCTVSQTEIALTFAKLGDRTYGAGEAPYGGRPAVWVGTTDLAKQTTTISWQATGAAAGSPIAAQTHPVQFAGLLTLSANPQSLPLDSADQPMEPRASAG